MENLLEVAVCEDNPKDMDTVCSYFMASKMVASCHTFDSGESFLEHFKAGQYDLVFLDIYMTGMLGVDAAAEIRKIDKGVTLAFTTTSPDHSLASYRLKAIAYLEKPVSKADIEEVLSLAMAKKKTGAYISLLIDGKERPISLSSILYFEAQNHAVTINTNREILRTSQSVKLDHIEPLLPDHFIRCHGSYLVNLQYVKELDRELSIFIMENGDNVHIRQKDLAKVLKCYEDYLFAETREDG